MPQLMPPAAIRSRFSTAMSAMYRAEVPLYADLLAMVAAVNAAVLAADPRTLPADEVARLDVERHGAVRVGTAAELRLLARVFAVMGMEPVGYYDLAGAGVPVHSTAFRAIDPAGLMESPFRVFTSLLRLELIADEGLRAEAAATLAARRIASPRCEELVAQAEAQGGLSPADAAIFVAEALDIFRWRDAAAVDLATYQHLVAAHRLVADVVAFRGPHINHLTPRTLDIDAVQAEMQARGIAAKDTIEGPPPRRVPILLRQTSFRALSEPFRTADGDATAAHTARFGEIEQRGAALTRAGQALYDACLAHARDGDPAQPYPRRLQAAFAEFPDDLAALHAAGLAHVRFALAPGMTVLPPDITPATAIAGGLVTIAPLTYEDFLPVSAAGIFRSNLGGEAREAFAGRGSQAAFEADLGRAVHDPFALYAAAEAASWAALPVAVAR